LSDQTTKSKAHTPKRGRPTRDQAGEVESRILNAALKVFIERGYEGASIDEIAEVARAGKPSIYARFTNKELLFRDVVTRWSQRVTEIVVPDAVGSIEERFQTIGVLIVQRSVNAETVGLMRSVIAEATRHPELATTIHYNIRSQGSVAVTKLVSELAEAEEIHSLPAFAPANLALTARRFIDLVLLPIMMRSLFHADLTQMLDEMESHAKDAASFFLRACGYETT
jgi:AcrR family transcriptional regulator